MGGIVGGILDSYGQLQGKTDLRSNNLCFQVRQG